VPFALRWIAQNLGAEAVAWPYLVQCENAPADVVRRLLGPAFQCDLLVEVEDEAVEAVEIDDRRRVPRQTRLHCPGTRDALTPSAVLHVRFTMARVSLSRVL
jgi:hypothetical protein